MECQREQRDGERGWRSYLTTDRDEPDYEPTEAIVYCPDCASASSARHERTRQATRVGYEDARIRRLQRPGR
jgi:hypothetical protein